MSDKETFELKYEFGQLKEDVYHIYLENVVGNIYTDGYKLFEITESFVYLLEKDEETEESDQEEKTDKRKVKKKRVAKRKDQKILISNKKDEFVFSPEVVFNNTRINF